MQTGPHIPDVNQTKGHTEDEPAAFAGDGAPQRREGGLVVWLLSHILMSALSRFLSCHACVCI